MQEFRRADVHIVRYGRILLYRLYRLLRHQQ